jgi:hypothetical protein
MQWLMNLRIELIIAPFQFLLCVQGEDIQDFAFFLEWPRERSLEAIGDDSRCILELNPFTYSNFRSECRQSADIYIQLTQI